MDIYVIIAKVVLPFPIRQYFKYFMPNLAHPVIGGRVVVPFNSKDVVGIVIDFYEIENYSELNFKSAKLLIDNDSLYNNTILNILLWISRHYHHPIGNVFFSVLPKCLRTNYIPKDINISQWEITKKGQELNINDLKNRKKQCHALLILRQKSILMTELKKYNVSKFVLKTLENKKLCKKSMSNIFFFKNKYDFKLKKKFFLNKKILLVISNVLDKKCFKSWLLTNINLYIKVKFYLGVIKKVLHRKMQILILVPYIKNINIIVVFLKKYFNVSINSVYSKLNSKQYLKVWFQSKNGTCSIVIGTKKSIFLPFLNLGLIIILQEHNLQYKNTNQLRYHIRDLGILRAYRENIPIILDSDTPSLKTLCNVFYKKCFCINLYQHDSINRYNYNVINLKKEKVKFRLSLTLIKEIYKNIQTQQVLLIFNKFSLFFCILMCNICSWVCKCVLCKDDVEINQYHNVLFCTFCLIKIEKPKFCYNCGSVDLLVKSINLEQIKSKIKKIFPTIPLFFLFHKKKIDIDCFKKHHDKISFPNPYIIISTEEIVENYYFPNVRLISLISIDHHYLSFHFRSIEYFSQFYINLNQLTRFRKESLNIFIQTSLSYKTGLNNTGLKEIYKNRYHNFAKMLLSVRKKFLLPPWSCHSIIYSESICAEHNISFLNLIRKVLKKQSSQNNTMIWFFGPYNSFKLNDKKKFFNQLLIQCSSRTTLNCLLNITIDIVNIFTVSKRVKWFIDIEPN